MNRKLFAFLVVSVLLFSSTRAIAQSPEPLTPQTSLGTGFTYQGQLKNAGSPVNSPCDMQFSLWDAAGNGSPPTGGSQVGIMQTLAVTVTNGLFTVVLNSGNEFGNSAFAGDARWLQMAVSCPAGSGGAYTTLSPRQALAAVPYALSLTPNATINGLNNTGNLSFGSTTRQMLNLWGTRYGIGVQGYDAYFRTDSGAGFAWFSGGTHSDTHYNPGALGATLMTLDSNSLTVNEQVSASINSAGLTAAVNATNSGSGYGVYGQGNLGAGIVGESSGSHGVFGTAGLSNTFGVYGLNTGSGYGVGGDGPLGGVYGRTANSFGGGLYGYNNGALGATGAGVVGNGLNNAGVVAISFYGNPIVAYGSDLNNKRFVVDQSGNVTADGTYSSPAADLAELLPAAGQLEPGDVLVIGQDGKLTRSASKYQTSVVGVYSTKPAFLGGYADGADTRDQVPLAMIGVVPTKVSAENGAIHPGDLLVASSTPGHAMKADAHPPIGTVIGKALGSLERGTGIIQIVVMLQ
jgi:hypothetical protein